MLRAALEVRRTDRPGIQAPILRSLALVAPDSLAVQGANGVAWAVVVGSARFADAGRLGGGGHVVVPLFDLLASIHELALDAACEEADGVETLRGALVHVEMGAFVGYRAVDSVLFLTVLRPVVSSQKATFSCDPRAGPKKSKRRTEKGCRWAGNGDGRSLVVAKHKRGHVSEFIYTILQRLGSLLTSLPSA